MNSLSAWLQSVPERLRISITRDDGATINRAAVNVYLLYHSCVSLTTRPIFFYIIRQHSKLGTSNQRRTDWKEGLSDNIVFMVDYAMKAASEAISLMERAREHSMIGKLVIEHHSPSF